MPSDASLQSAHGSGHQYGVDVASRESLTRRTLLEPDEKTSTNSPGLGRHLVIRLVHLLHSPAWIFLLWVNIHIIPLDSGICRNYARHSIRTSLEDAYGNPADCECPLACTQDCA